MTGVNLKYRKSGQYDQNLRQTRIGKVACPTILITHKTPGSSMFHMRRLVLSISRIYHESELSGQTRETVMQTLEWWRSVDTETGLSLVHRNVQLMTNGTQKHRAQSGSWITTHRHVVVTLLVDHLSNPRRITVDAVLYVFLSEGGLHPAAGCT